MYENQINKTNRYNLEVLSKTGGTSSDDVCLYSLVKIAPVRIHPGSGKRPDFGEVGEAGRRRWCLLG